MGNIKDSIGVQCDWHYSFGAEEFKFVRNNEPILFSWDDKGNSEWLVRTKRGLKKKKFSYSNSFSVPSFSVPVKTIQILDYYVIIEIGDPCTL